MFSERPVADIDGFDLDELVEGGATLFVLAAVLLCVGCRISFIV